MLSQDVMCKFFVDLVRLGRNVAGGLVVVVERDHFGEGVLHPHPPIPRPRFVLGRIEVAAVVWVAQLGRFHVVRPVIHRERLPVGRYTVVVALVGRAVRITRHVLICELRKIIDLRGEDAVTFEWLRVPRLPRHRTCLWWKQVFKLRIILASVPIFYSWLGPTLDLFHLRIVPPMAHLTFASAPLLGRLQAVALLPHLLILFLLIRQLLSHFINYLLHKELAHSRLRSLM